MTDTYTNEVVCLTNQVSADLLYDAGGGDRGDEGN